MGSIVSSTQQPKPCFLQKQCQGCGAGRSLQHALMRCHLFPPQSCCNLIMPWGQGPFLSRTLLNAALIPPLSPLGVDVQHLTSGSAERRGAIQPTKIFHLENSSVGEIDELGDPMRSSVSFISMILSRRYFGVFLIQGGIPLIFEGAGEWKEMARKRQRNCPPLLERDGKSREGDSGVTALTPPDLERNISKERQKHLLANLLFLARKWSVSRTLHPVIL